jgi:hypothetical protein
MVGGVGGSTGVDGTTVGLDGGPGTNGSAPGDEGGCGCRLAGSREPGRPLPALGLLGLGLLLLCRRERRRAR